MPRFADQRRLARIALWVLLALSVPYALMMAATGMFFGLWNAPDRLLTIIWILIVTSPIWLALMLVVGRKYPGSSILIAVLSWLAAGLLLAYIYR